MIRDFYLRNEDDPNYLPDIIETSDEIECLIYQIRMTLETDRGDVLGDPSFGVGLNMGLFQPNVNVSKTVENIKAQVTKYSLLMSEYTTNFSGYKLTNGYRDTCIIEISVLGQTIMGYNVN